MTKNNPESILKDLQALEYVLMIRPYGMDRVTCHGQLGYIRKLYRQTQRKSRVHLSQDIRYRWNQVKKLYNNLKSDGYFDPKVTSCAMCSFAFMCDYKDYTKYTKYK